jgi:hypothetical protein
MTEFFASEYASVIDTPKLPEHNGSQAPSNEDRVSDNGLEYTTEKISYKDILVEGDQDFIFRTKQALEMLEGVQAYELVKSYIKMIKQAERSGMRLHGIAPTFEVGESTSKASAQWYASAIVHDGNHSLLYYEARKNNQNEEPPISAWAGADAERQCLRMQLEALRELLEKEKSTREVNKNYYAIYLENLIGKDASYQKDPLSWDDYHKRNW